MIPLFLTPYPVTKTAGSLSHTEIVTQLYFQGKAKSVIFSLVLPILPLISPGQ